MQPYTAVLLQHEFGIFGGVHGEFVLELLRSLRMPVVTTLHTVQAHASHIRMDVATHVLQWSAAAVTLAGDGCRATRSWAHAYGAAAVDTSCVHIPHGVPPPSPCPPAWHRAALGFHAETFLILTGGLLSPGKGIEHVVAAMPAVLAVNPQARLLIMGSPHPSDKHSIQYAAQLRHDVATSEARHAIHFVSGYLATSQVARLYAAAHVFVAAHASRSQRSSGTLAAACAAGAAGVGTRFPAAIELIEGPHGGIVVRHDDQDALASALAALVADPARTAGMGARCGEAMRVAHWQVVGEHYAQLALEGAKRHGTPGPGGVRHSAGGATAWLPSCSVAQAPLRTSISNGLMVAFGVRNPDWVDGLGPGWGHLDTWIGRARSGWGTDAVLLKGTMLTWTEAALAPADSRRPFRPRTVRLFEAPDCEMAANVDEATGAARLVQSCVGAAGAATWSANRTLWMAPRSAAVRMAVDVALRLTSPPDGGGKQPPRLSVCVDQLTAAVGDPAYFKWRIRNQGALRAARRRRGWRRHRGAGPVLQVPLASLPLVLDSTDSRGCATQLALSLVPVAGGDAALGGEVRLDGEGHPHAVVFHHHLSGGAGQPREGGRAAGGVMRGGQALWGHSDVELRWSAAQKQGAPQLCAPALDE